MDKLKNYFLIIKGSNKNLAEKEFECLYDLFFKKKVKLENVTHNLYKFKSSVIFRRSFLERLTFTNYIGLELCFSKTVLGLTEKILYYKRF